MLRNAIHYAPDGTPVEVDMRRRSGTATITVRDFGTGVPDESLPAIFQPFYRVDDDRSRSRGGVGLGLSITQCAIAVHGGEILAGSGPTGSHGHYQTAGVALTGGPHVRVRRDGAAGYKLLEESLYDATEKKADRFTPFTGSGTLG